MLGFTQSLPTYWKYKVKIMCTKASADSHNEVTIGWYLYGKTSHINDRPAVVRTDEERPNEKRMEEINGSIYYSYP